MEADAVAETEEQTEVGAEAEVEVKADADAFLCSEHELCALCRLKCLVSLIFFFP